MQSYQLHIVSEQLKQRHPYLQPPFKARYDSTEVYKAVFDRTIPKLIQILLTEDLPSNRYASAFITLNQIASDEIEKSNMIQQGVVGVAAAYTHCKVVSIRRQATLLLGLLLSCPSGLAKMSIPQTFQGLKKLLFDEELEVRNAVSWTILRIVLSRIGTQILCKNGIAPTIIESFLKYSGQNKREQQYFIIYLLQSFKHLLTYDDGIKHCVGTGLTRRLKELAKTQEVYSEHNNSIIHSLSLGALSNLAMNQEGKEECIKEQVIETAQEFLESQVSEEVSNSVSLIMFSAIHLQGKKQCIYKNQKIDTKIIIKLIKLLGPIKSGLKEGEKPVCQVCDLVKGDVKEALKIISQEHDAFLAIADYMSKEADIVDIESIFGCEFIVSLAELLPKASDVAEPPTLPSNKINDYKAYAKTINHFLSKYPQALQIALTKCVDLVSRLLFFICYRGDKLLQEGIAKSLQKLSSEHEYSLILLKELVNIHGEKQHKISKTTICNQVRNYKNLKELLEQ